MMWLSRMRGRCLWRRLWRRRFRGSRSRCVSLCGCGMRLWLLLTVLRPRLVMLMRRLLARRIRLWRRSRLIVLQLRQRPVLRLGLRLLLRGPLRRRLGLRRRRRRRLVPRRGPPLLPTPRPPLLTGPLRLPPGPRLTRLRVLPLPQDQPRLPPDRRPRLGLRVLARRLLGLGRRMRGMRRTVMPPAPRPLLIRST